MIKPVSSDAGKLSRSRSYPPTNCVDMVWGRWYIPSKSRPTSVGGEAVVNTEDSSERFCNTPGTEHS
jgi:hypothetical protein